MTFSLNYGVVFGKGDSSDVFEWEVELSEEQEKAYHRAIMTGTAFDEVSELSSLCDDAYDDIEEEVLDGFRMDEDEYTLDCLGENEVDPEELNNLVHSKDQHALEFLGLVGLSDEELEDWDAEIDLNEIPLVKDFQEGFEPMSPFDCGWTLNVWLPENEETPTDEEIEAFLEEALSADDVVLAEEIVDGQEDNYSGDLADTAFCIAIRVGCKAYVQDHCDDVELNREDGWSSPYLDETDDKDMRDLLISCGARVNWMEYDGYSLAIETVNYSVLSFTESFQDAVFQKLLSVLSLTSTQLAEILADEKALENYQMPSVLDEFSLEEVCEALQIELDEGDVSLSSFGYMDSDDGSNVKDIVEALGWQFDFEGQEWGLGASGVYYIE